jgi:DNA-binding response OmpR family regulator
MPSVLVVEDEPKLRELLRGYLERDGHTVVSTGSGATALTMAASDPPDLVILDLGLPDVSGEAVARELLRTQRLPILMLTARAEESDRIRGLELGADDYVTKPFSPRELILRVRAVLRRAQERACAAPTWPDDGRSSYGGGMLVLDQPRRQVHAHGRVVDLTATEWGLLLALARSPGRVYSRAELINRIRGYEFEGYERSIDSHVKNLRRKIERDSRHPEIVLTVQGGGYRMGIEADRPGS